MSEGKARLSVRWIVIGAAIVVAAITLADRLLVAYVDKRSGARGDPAATEFDVMQSTIHKDPSKVSQEEKAALRSMVAAQWQIVAALALALLLVPVTVGTLIGRGTSSVLSAAIAVCVGAIVGAVILQITPISIGIGAVAYFGLGAVSGVVGKRLAARREQRRKIS